MLIAQELEKLRKEIDMNQATFAKYIGSNPSTYNHIVAGRRLPSIRFIENLSEATQTDITKWLELLEKDKVVEEAQILRNKMVHSGAVDDLEMCDIFAGTGALNHLSEFYKNVEAVRNVKEDLVKTLATLNESENKKDDTCTSAIKLLIDTGLIKNIDDIDKSTTVKELILAAAKKEVEKLLK